MTEREWLTSNDPAVMLGFVRGTDWSDTSHEWNCRASDRKLRLFACACRRRVPGLSWSGQSAGWQEMEDHPEREILANGVGPRTVSAEEHARLFLSEIMRPEGRPSDSQMADLLREIIGNPFRPVTIPTVVCNLCNGSGVYDYPECAGDNNPCPRCDGKKSHCPWLTPTVVSLATAAYQERPGRVCENCKGTGEIRSGHPLSWKDCSVCGDLGRVEDGRLDNDRLAVLADALSDAGCPETVECGECAGIGAMGCSKCSGEGCSVYSIAANGPCTAGDPCKPCKGVGSTTNPILTHLRSEGMHVRGCWVLDLLLEKS